MATDRTPSADADVCVVGAGPGGTLVANDLARRGHRVVVLEAGPRFGMDDLVERMEAGLRPSGNPLEVWGMGGPRDRYSVGGPVSYRVNANRVKAVGGSTLHWGGMAPRFHEKDFEMATRYGMARDWPISYAELRPYYVAAEREMGISGADDSPVGPPREEPFPVSGFPPSYSDSIFAPACEEVGVAMHTAPRAQIPESYDGRSACLAFGTCSPVCPSGSKYDATRHARKAESAGARVVDRAPVQRLEHDDAGERVTAAVYRTPEGEEHRQEAEQFVVACGAIETARLLLLSESPQYPDGLANSSGAVGRYFMTHPSIETAGRLGRRTGQHRIGFPTSISHQFVPHEDTPGSIQLEFDNVAGPSLSGLALDGNEGLERLRALAGGVTDPDAWQGVAASAGEGARWGDDLLAGIREAFGDHLGIIAIVEQLPRAENRVTLDRSTTDEHGNPVPEVTLSLSDHVEAVRERAAEIQRDILAATGADPETFGTTRTLTPHQMGTTRMGTDPTESVVNPRLRTHDLTNLSVASASAFVTGSAVNPTLTIGALALKCADAVDTDL
jgi:choline dehydrogenase-like flavoprotein